MNNKYFQLIQVVVTSLAFYYLYNFFSNEANSSEINIQIGTNALLIIVLLFLANSCHSYGWADLYNKEQGFDYKDTYLFAMKSHIGKYSFIKFGNFFIRLSQNYEQTEKKKFLTKALLEQFILVVFGMSFGLFYVLPTNNPILIIFLIIMINFILMYLFRKFINKKTKGLIEFKNFRFYIATTFLQFISLSIYFNDLDFEKYLYFAAIYLFSSAISIIVSVIPAGLGVKESIFLYVSSGIFNNTYFLNLLIEIRILFIISDILSYLYSVILLKNKN
tara:strand:- start:717 stop:1544 length:828 start_codon:yes stop_codon:yes gene_type:complete